MLTDVDYWIACGGYDPSALGSMIPRAGHGRCSGVRQTAIAKSLGRNRALKPHTLQFLGQGEGRISLVCTDYPESPELRKEKAYPRVAS